MLPVAVVAADAPAWSLLALLSLPLVNPPMQAVLRRTDGESLNGALAGTGMLLAAFSVLLTAGLLIAQA